MGKTSLTKRSLEKINEYKNNQATTKNLGYRTLVMQHLMWLLVKCSHKLLAKQIYLFISKEYLCTQYPITTEGVCYDLTLKSLY